MFETSGWFVIDAANRQVKGVRVASLEDGLRLVGEGAVATVVGRLRPEVCVVDIDLHGDRGHAAAEQLSSWCAREGLWCLVRPSGGADGRYHVFVAPEGKGAALAAFVEQLRRSLKASARAIDLRRSGHIRPLSAPHRGGVMTRPYGEVRTALQALLAHAWASKPSDPGPSRTQRTDRDASRGATAGPLTALTPRPRPRRDLPPEWATYLTTGAVPPIGGEDRSRSTVEAIATGHLLRAGHTADTAWAEILAAHPAAMVRARASKRRWVAWVWNRAVEEDRAHCPAPDLSPAVAAAVAAGRERLTAFMWTQPVRRRRALLLVGHHVLDRMERTNSRRVPVPERDLVEDTCLTDRKTIRTALRLLNGPLGLLDTKTWDPTRRADSSFEFEIPEAPDPGVREIPPPSSHTPLPRGTWSQLPGPSHALWRQLPDATGPPLTASELAQRSGLSDSRDQAPTQSQLRSTQAALTALAAAGLAHCAADATWSRRSTITSDHAERSTARHAEISAIVVAERRRYRAADASWQRARARALKQQISRERAWWDGLEATERVQRRTEWVRRFDQLPVQKQERLKARLATKRVRAGMDERARHAEWVASMDSDEFLERSVTRQQRFEGLAPPLQQAFAASWQRHRAHFGIDRGLPVSTARSEHAALLPDGVEQRDDAFLTRQLDIVADLNDVS